MITISKLPFNLDYKLVATILTAVVVYALTAAVTALFGADVLTHTLIGIEPPLTVGAAISLAAAAAVGYLTPPSLGIDVKNMGGGEPLESRVTPDNPGDQPRAHTHITDAPTRGSGGPSANLMSSPDRQPLSGPTVGFEGVSTPRSDHMEPRWDRPGFHYAD